MYVPGWIRLSSGPSLAHIRLSSDACAPPCTNLTFTNAQEGQSPPPAPPRGAAFGGLDDPPPADAVLTTSPELRVCVAGEGEPPLELLLAAVACAASGEVLRVPVQQLREGDLVELDLSRRGVGVGGVRLLAFLLPSCSKLVRLK